MKHRLAAPFFAVLVLALAAFTGSALAGGGQGNGGGASNGNSANAPGHQTTQAPAPAPAAAPAAAPAKPAKPDKPAKPAKSTKQSSTSASNPATGGSNAQGVKPSNTTKHDTYAKASSSQTKQYGNGKTAGQIATKAGYGDATLHGPGNSQPHKVLCGGHEVDVHALAHKKDKCGPSSTQAQTATETKSNDVQSASACAATTQTVTEQVLVGVKHMIGPKGSGRYVLIHPSTHSAHYTGKHADDVPVYQTVTKTVSVPTGANCASTQTAVTSSSSATPAGGVAAATATPAAAAPATASAPASASAPAAAAPVAAGGVKGAVIALHPTKAKPAGGVLGATTRLGGTIASAHLPFTGLPLWIFTLVALALIAGGYTLRRASSNHI